MKFSTLIKYFPAFLILMLPDSHTNAQDRFSRVQLEIGTGVITSGNEWLAPAIPINIELKTQKGLIDFAMKYQRSLGGLGVDHPQTSLFPGHKTLYSTLAPIDPDNLNRLAHFESLQAIGEIHLNFEYFKPVIGFGFSLNRFRSFKQKVFRTNLPTDVFLIEPPVFYGWMIRMGHKIDRMRFYVEYHHHSIFGLKPVLQLGTAVNFGLTEKSEKEVRFYNPEYSESRFENLIFRIEFNGGVMASLGHEKFSGAQLLGADLQLRVAGHHFVGFGAGFITRFAGYDRGTQTYINGTDLLLTNAADQTRFIAVYYMYNYQITITKAFYFGGGPGLYTVPGELRPLPENIDRLILPYEFETSRKPGLNVFAGLRSGLLSNTLRLHFPAGDIPVLMEYKLGVGLNFHK